MFNRILTFFVFWLARAIRMTMRVTMIGDECLPDATAPHKSVVVVGWHGRTFVAITSLRNRGYWAMISTSRDGDLQNMLFHRFGFRTVRGSSSARGAVESALTLRRELANGGVLMHTPDGPRGPSGLFHPGAIFLAQKAGCPIVPAIASSWPCWTISTWDHYQIPKPFSRGVIIYGPPTDVPSKLDDAGRQALADRIGDQINALQIRADEFVRSPSKGTPKLSDSRDPMA